MNKKSSVTAQHTVRIETSKILKYFSDLFRDILKEELHSDDLDDVDVVGNCGDYIILVKNLEY